jgi:hypothetical protein
MNSPAQFNLVVEGSLDEQVAKKVLRSLGIEVFKVYEKRGKSPILQHLKEYDRRAKHSYFPWIVLVDLDDEEECAPLVIKKYLPQSGPRLAFRVAVREIEAWLLADRERVANFLGVPRERIPHQAEGEEDPKGTIVKLARRSRIRSIKEELLPREGSGAKQGPLYTSRMIEFVLSKWRPEVAAKGSDSLARFIKAAKNLA